MKAKIYAKSWAKREISTRHSDHRSLSELLKYQKLHINRKKIEEEKNHPKDEHEERKPMNYS